MSKIKWETWKDTAVPDINKKSSQLSLREIWDWAYEFLNSFRYELQECVEKNDTVRSFHEWIALEIFFGQRLYYEQYKSVAQYYKDDPHGLGVKDILNLGMKDAPIRAFRKGDIVWAYINNESTPKKVKILGLLTTDECDLFDVGPMFDINILDPVTPEESLELEISDTTHFAVFYSELKPIGERT